VKDLEFNPSFDSVKETFDRHIKKATLLLDKNSLKEYYKWSEFFSKIGQGDKPSIEFIKIAHFVGEYYGDGAITKVAKFGYDVISKSPNKNRLALFFSTFKALIEHKSKDELDEYLKLISYFLEQTTTSIHGHHLTHESPSFEAFLNNMKTLLEHLDFEGIYFWINYGLRYFKDHPQNQELFFSLSEADSKAVFARARKGDLLEDLQKPLDCLIKALYDKSYIYAPYSPDFESLDHFAPYIEDGSIRLPDLYTNMNSLTSYERYVALITHIIAHENNTTKVIADNLSPHQRMFVEVFEDARVEHIECQKYPGLKKLWKALIPQVDEFACNDANISCIRHRAVILARALCDENHPYTDKTLLEFVQKFKDMLKDGNSTTQDCVSLGVSYLARTRQKSDSLSEVFFKNTTISYRDDNRHMWLYIEQEDEEEDIFVKQKPKPQSDDELEELIAPRYYDEYDYLNKSYKYDWVSVYERILPKGDGSKIDRLLDTHSNTCKQIKKALDLLKPQNKKRIRYQEEGSELDLDIALKSMIDLKNGSQPNLRINSSFEHDCRSVSVLLLLDLSHSLNDTPQGSNKTILQLSQEAVSILAWATDAIGDKFAIAGFNSNTRKQVMYYHIKAYNESFEDAKSRLSNIKAEYSTRMGGAIRHGAHYLKKQQSDKKLMLILTDGEPADIDVSDDNALKQDTYQALQEIKKDGIYPYCISLDNKADSYIKEIFGNHYTIINDIASLPKKLPNVFLSLIK